MRHYGKGGKDFFRIGVKLPNNSELKPITKEYIWRPMGKGEFFFCGVSIVIYTGPSLEEGMGYHTPWKAYLRQIIGSLIYNAAYRQIMHPLQVSKLVSSMLFTILEAY